MSTVKNFFYAGMLICLLWLSITLCYVVSQLVFNGREYIDSYEEKYYDYQLYLHQNDIRIEDKYLNSTTIHPDSLEEFIKADNL